MLQYEPVPFGMVSAREAVAAYYAERGARLLPGQVLLTTSTSEAYSFCFRLLCDPEDEVLIARPSYPLFDFLATIQDVKLVPFSLVYDHGWQIDFHSLQQAITPRTRAIVLVHPNNPTGSFVKAGEVMRLNEVCNQHQLALICDEVFLDYSLAARQQSFAANDGPAARRDAALARLEVIADTYLSMNAPVQHAVPTLLETRHGIQQQIMAHVRANLAALDQQLAAKPECVRLEVEGGWYAVLRLPVHGSDEDFIIRLLEEKKVIAHPGHFFDFESDGYVIVSLITPEEDFREGIRRLLAIVQ